MSRAKTALIIEGRLEDGEPRFHQKKTGLGKKDELDKVEKEKASLIHAIVNQKNPITLVVELKETMRSDRSIGAH